MRAAPVLITAVKRVLRVIFNIISKPFVMFVQIAKQYLYILHKFIKKRVKNFFCYLQIKINCYNKYIKKFFIKKKIRKIKEPIKESVRKKV